MTATVTADQTLNLRVHPQISAETREALARERKKLAADPSLVLLPADLTANAKYLFRTRPGTYRQLLHKLPLPPDEANFSEHPAKFQFQMRTWGRLVAQPMFPNLKREDAIKAATKRLTEVFERLGSDQIIFRRVKRAVECYYPTDDEVIAGYLRDLIATGREPWDRVYEVSGRSRIVLTPPEGEPIAFPNTEGGRKLAFARLAESGGAISTVEE